MRRTPRATTLTALTAAAALLVTACAPASAPAADSSAAPDQTVVAFYGDSYTLGTGASDPANRWSSRISEARGWFEVNPSVNGLGFVKHREAGGLDLPADIIAADPDIVFVTMGLNDAYGAETADSVIRDQIERDFARLSDALPDARFIVVEPFWYTSERPESLFTIADWVKDAADGIGADWIPGASTWIAGREGEMASDGLHPNDDGYAKMTRHMEEALAGLGL